RRDPIESYHDRVRESVVAHLGAPAQRSWHARLAVALETAEQPDPEALVAHWSGAGHPERAASYATKAAERAEKTRAYGSAVRLHGRARGRLRPRGGARRQPLVRLGGALINAGRGFEAAGILAEAAEGAEPAQASALRRRAAEQYLRSGHVEKGAEFVQKSL